MFVFLSQLAFSSGRATAACARRYECVSPHARSRPIAFCVPSWIQSEVACAGKGRVVVGRCSQMSPPLFVSRANRPIDPPTPRQLRRVRVRVRVREG